MLLHILERKDEADRRPPTGFTLSAYVSLVGEDRLARDGQAETRPP